MAVEPWRVGLYKMREELVGNISFDLNKTTLLQG
jgi:hypothetical protein